MAGYNQSGANDHWYGGHDWNNAWDYGIADKEPSIEL
jgi:hypothetical protein